MKAIIMAGGEGSRLRPLTCDLPKPMARLCGRPVLEYILDLLGLNGFIEAKITLRYMPQVIINHFNGNIYKDISLDFVIEDEPLGTAGSVKNASSSFDDDFLVISGDAMCDYNLKGAFEYHKSKGAAVTIIAAKVDDPREYGLINSTKDGLVSGFVEKPGYAQAVTDLANTGIYIISPEAISEVPDKTNFDFAKDLFPLLLAQNKKIAVFEANGYWCDIGDLTSYITCQKDMLSGKVKSDITENCSLNSNVFIGKGTVIDKTAKIEGFCVIDENCYVGENTKVNDSIMLNGSYLAIGARLNGAIVCNGASVMAGSAMYEGSVAGAGAVIGENSTVNSGIKIWPFKTVCKGTIVSNHLQYGTSKNELFEDDGICGEAGIDMNPDFCSKLGAALGSTIKKNCIIIASNEGNCSSAFKKAFISGVVSTGIDAVNVGEILPCEFEYLASILNIETGVYIKSDIKTSIKLYSDYGLPSNRNLERSMESGILRGEFKRVPSNLFGKEININNTDVIYKSAILKNTSKKFKGVKINVDGESGRAKNIILDCLNELECDIAETSEYSINVNQNGNNITLTQNGQTSIDSEHIIALCCLFELEKGNDVAIPFDAPQILTQISNNSVGNILRYFNCPADNSDKKARELAISQPFVRDSIIALFKFLDYIIDKGLTINEVKQSIPEFCIEQKEVSFSGKVNHIMKILLEEKGKDGQIPEGVSISFDEGVVFVRPLKNGTVLKLMAQANNSETARELCDSFEEYIANNLIK